MIPLAAGCKDKKVIAAALIKEPRGFHKGALLAGARPIGLMVRNELISAKNRVKDRLYELADARP